jgi:hypothetical protein
MTELDTIIYVLSLEKFERPSTFLLVHHDLSDKVYWWLAGQSWSYISVYPFAKQWIEILESPRSQREMFAFSDADRKHWNSLPDDLTIYRTYSTKNRNGLYTSLSLEVALEFGYHCHGANARIDTFQVKKSDCLYRGGYQYEVIHLPRYRAIAEGNL